MKKILSSVLISFAALTTLSFATPSAVHASKYVAGVPTFLKNKTWQSGYASSVGKGPSPEASKFKTTFKITGNKLSAVNDMIANGKHSTYKTKDTILKYKKLSNNKYHLVVKGIYTNGNYTVKVIGKNHIKMNLNLGLNQSYYTK